MTNPNTPEYDDNGIAWYPAESRYAPPDAVPQEPPTHDLDVLRVAIARGERLHFRTDQVALDTEGRPNGLRTLRYEDVSIAPERDDEDETPLG